MQYGPVPSLALDFIKREEYSLRLAEIEQVDESIEVSTDNKKHRISAKRRPDLMEFSRTDIQILNETLQRCKTESFESLYEKSHEELAWKEAWNNRDGTQAPKMNYELFIDDSENRDEIIEYMRNTATCVVL